MCWELWSIVKYAITKLHHRRLHSNGNISLYILTTAKYIGKVKFSVGQFSL